MDQPSNYVLRSHQLGQNCFRTLTHDSSNRYNTTEDFVLTGNDTTTQLLLPGYYLPYPSLKNYGMIWYRIHGKIARTAGVNTILIEPVVDGAPTGVTINPGAIATRTGTGWITIDIKTSIIHHEDNTGLQAWEVSLLSADSAGAKIDDFHQTARTTISPLTSHQVYYRIKNNTSDATNVLDLRSFMGGHFWTRSI